MNTNHHLTSGENDHEVLLATSSKDGGKALNFKSLPRDVMYRIMECLLRAEDVAKKDSKHTRKYSFQVQSLRVCRELHGLGTSVFRLNHFLLVSIGNSSIMKFVDLHLLHYFTAKLKNLKEYSCRIHISSKHEKMKPSTFFVMCLTDIPVLVNALRECAFMYEQEIKLHFQIKAIEGVFMPVKQQRTLPLPFIKLRGTRQTCIITGADPALACEVSTKVSHNTHWKRDQLRKHFEILEIKKQLADDARMNGHDIVVRTLYESVMDFIAGTSYTDDMAIQHNEPSFVEGKKMIFFESELFLSRIDMSCVCLQEDLIYFRRLAMMSPNTWPDSLRDWEAIHLQRMGVAKFAYGYFDEASECFESALEILEALGNNPTSVQRCQELQAAASDSELVIQGPQTWQEIAMSFVRLLPSSHETKPFVLEVPTLAGLEQDLYDLEVLGYIGDLHEGELKQKKGWSIKAGEEVNEPFDKRIRDKQLVKYLAEDAECDAKGVPRLHRDVAVRTGRLEDDAPPIDPQVDLAQYATFLGTSTSSIAIPLEHNTFGGLPHYAQLWAQNPYYEPPAGSTNIAWTPLPGPLPPLNPAAGMYPSALFSMGSGGSVASFNNGSGILPPHSGHNAFAALLAQLDPSAGHTNVVGGSIGGPITLPGLGIAPNPTSHGQFPIGPVHSSTSLATSQVPPSLSAYSNLQVPSPPPLHYPGPSTEPGFAPASSTRQQCPPPSLSLFPGTEGPPSFTWPQPSCPSPAPSEQQFPPPSTSQFLPLSNPDPPSHPANFPGTIGFIKALGPDGEPGIRISSKPNTFIPLQPGQNYVTAFMTAIGKTEGPFLKVPMSAFTNSFAGGGAAAAGAGGGGTASSTGGGSNGPATH